MPPPTTIAARAAAVTGAAIKRGGGSLARAALTLSVLTAAAAGLGAAGAGPAAAAPAVLYAAPAGTGTGDCSTTANACILATALSDVAAGGVVELVTPGGAGHYVGNWSVTTPGTSASLPVTVEPAPGLAGQPVLDGNNGSATGCPTTACDGPVLTVPANEFVALSGITITNANNSSTNGGGLANGGAVTITGSTFTGNNAGNEEGSGGAIVNTGSVTVTASTFSGNTATAAGGAISNGLGFLDGGSVTVTASTFTGNTAGFGGAIDSGDYSGGGTVTVTASTFTGNSASLNGNTIDGGDNSGGGTVAVAGDVFDGSCHQAGGVWTDGGYNAGSDGSCYGSGPPSSDLTSPAPPRTLGLGPLADNGGPTQTIEPQPVTPATVIGLIPSPTTITLGGNPVVLCPATDQRGYLSASGTACDAGAVQTMGSPPALALKDSASPATFNTAGQVITYSYRVANTGAGTFTGIKVSDPAVPTVSCPAPVLASGTSEMCTGTYTTTAADLAAGKITATATATAAAGGVPVASSPATVTVAKGWPPAVTGTFRPAAGAAEGYYLGVVNNTWQLLVTHPGASKVAFTGHISVPAGTLGHITLISPTAGHQVSTTGKVITFTLPDYGKVTGFSFTTAATVHSITLTLNIGGHPAIATRIYLGATPTPASTGSPLTYTR